MLVGAAAFAVTGTKVTWTRLRETVRVATASTPGSDAGEGAVVRARGVVEATAGTVTAPLSGRECIGYVLAQQQRYAVGALVKRWHSGHTEATVREFALDGPAGRTRIDPSSTLSPNAPATILELGKHPPGSVYSDLSLPRSTTSRVLPVDESPPAAVADAFQRGLPEPSNPHRYREWRVEPGDDLAVVGPHASTDPTDGDAAVENDGGTFVLSTTGRWRTVLVHVVRTLGYGLVTLGLLGVVLAKVGALTSFTVIP